MLKEETGLEIESNIATSYAAVVEAMGAGNTHFAWLPTFSYILAKEKYDVEPLLVVGRYGGNTYGSQIIARADSGIEELSDLAGKSFCRSDPVSTSSWIVPKVMMAAAGVPEADLTKIVEAGSHDAVVAAVYNGDCDAGATWIDARGEVEEEYPDVMDAVVVIDTSADIPNDNVSVIASVPDETADQIKTALQTIVQTEPGLEALGELYGVETLDEVDDSFYDDFRATLEESGLRVEDLAEQ
jgi:phosphonate transport system substrate-binding protein